MRAARWIAELPALLGGHYRQVILTVVDALGWELFQRFSKMDSAENERLAELVPESNIFPLTSVVPSTTASALTSFWTGLTPSSSWDHRV